MGGDLFCMMELLFGFVNDEGIIELILLVVVLFDKCFDE